MSQDPSKDLDSTSDEVSSTRRTFLMGVGLAGVAASLAPLSAADSALREHAAAGRALADRSNPNVPMEGPTAQVGEGNALKVDVALEINGKAHKVRIDPRASLLDTLRETIYLTGTKKGCDHGQCGACTVHMDGKRVLSCLSLALACQGKKITTIEGLGTPEEMHPMQAAFVKHDAFQCGYCTSGQIMSAVALMKEPVGPEVSDVKEAMSGNICRCGAYQNIVDAIQEVRKA